MAKNKYPNTTHQPMQTLDFTLDNGMRVRAVFSPQPDSTRTLVAHVALECVPADETDLSLMNSSSRPQTIGDAALLAFQVAESEAKRVGHPIIGARLEGEEFLEKSDVVQITNGLFPVDLF
jgi:hypothetical protein